VTGAAIPILVYHEISPHPRPAFLRYTVTVRNFARQMRWLAALGYRAINMDALVRGRRGHGKLPKRPFVITFDDGFQGSVDHAVPVLRAYGFTAVFYLVAGHMGGSSRWMTAETGLELPTMSWDTARGLSDGGFQCGAHSVTHPHLTQVTPAQCRAELVDGRKILESELGCPVVHLAYPFGSYDETVLDVAMEAGYSTGCSTRPGLSRADDDFLALHRVKVYGHDSLPNFISRVLTGTSVRQRLGGAVEPLASALRRRAGARP
jgi:peptidoglycan/xylan/chitin deacetylase (PgdA/CDA1 family)